MLNHRLEYQCLKTVLLHMDANIRFRISLHMPSIKSVEKVVPLKVQHLEMKNCTTMVNNTSYVVEVLRHYPEGNCPRPTELERSRIEPFSDFDEFGFPVVSGANVLLPGDVSFQEETPEVRHDTEEDERTYRKILRVQERALMILQKFESRGVAVGDSPITLEDVPDEELTEEDPLVRLFPRYTSEELLDFIGGSKLDILPFDCRKNNMKPPFTCYVQLTITKGESIHVERYEYNRKLFEASKHLNEVLFGGRTTIRVGRFPLSDDEVYRLPIGFRLHVNEARLSPNTVTHKNVQLIVENWESLSTLEINMLLSGLQSDAYKSQIVRNARRLSLFLIAEDQLETLNNAIKDLPNREICILPISLSNSQEVLFTLIQSWLNGQREDGASLLTRIRGEKSKSNVLKWIETRYEEIERTESSTTFHLNNSSGQEASCVVSQDASRMLTMNIVKV